MSPTFWSGLLQTFWPKKVADPEFGTLELLWDSTLSPSRFFGKGRWVGTATFAPLNQKVALWFNFESDNGSTSYQRELFHSLEANWRKLKSELAEQLFDSFRNWYGEAGRSDPVSVDQFFCTYAELGLVSIRGAQGRELDGFDVELGFFVLPTALSNSSFVVDHDHYLAAFLKDWTIVEVLWR